MAYIFFFCEVEANFSIALITLIESRSILLVHSLTFEHPQRKSVQQNVLISADSYAWGHIIQSMWTIKCKRLLYIGCLISLEKPTHKQIFRPKTNAMVGANVSYSRNNSTRCVWATESSNIIFVSFHLIFSRYSIGKICVNEYSFVDFLEYTDELFEF